LSSRSKKFLDFFCPFAFVANGLFYRLKPDNKANSKDNYKYVAGGKENNSFPRQKYLAARKKYVNFIR
jgi:hypothetical protein